MNLSANIKATDYPGNTALHNAISGLCLHDLLFLDDALAIIKLLLDSHANVNAENLLGKTALRVALDHTDISLEDLRPLIQMLIDYGADETIADRERVTPKIMVLSRAPVVRPKVKLLTR